MNKERQILNVSEDADTFYLDIRVAIPKSNISQEMVTDLINMKDWLVNGRETDKFKLKYSVIIRDDNGKDVIHVKANLVKDKTI